MNFRHFDKTSLPIVAAAAAVAVGIIAFGIHRGAPATGTVPAKGSVALTATSSENAGSGAGVSVIPKIPPMLTLPAGPVTYQIAQAATKLPGFVQATIDPLKVKVGQVQHFTVITNDPNPVVSVVATIVTDHKTVTVNLVSQGPAPLSMIVPRNFIVGSDGTFASAPTGVPPYAVAGGRGTHGGNVAEAANAAALEFKGQWTVEDTHNAEYKTTFTAKDSAGNVNSVTLQWSDPTPCSFDTGSGSGYTTGNVALSASCDVGLSGYSPVDGVESGNLSFSAALTLQVDANATLVINSGYSISMANGTIAMASGAKILLATDMCGTDADGDGYLKQSAWTAASSCASVSLTSRASITKQYGFNDCDDNNANVHPGQTAWFTSATTDTGSWDYNCDGSVEDYYSSTYQVPAITCNSNTCATGSCVSGSGSQNLGYVPSCGSTFQMLSSCSSVSTVSCGGSYGASCQASYSTLTQSCH